MVTVMRTIVSIMLESPNLTLHNLKPGKLMVCKGCNNKPTLNHYLGLHINNPTLPNQSFQLPTIH